MFTAISGFLSSSSIYIIATLLVLVGVLGFFSYHEINVVAEDKANIVSLTNVNLGIEQAAQKQEQACQINDKDVADLQTQKSALQARVDDLTNQLNTLPSYGTKDISVVPPTTPASKEVSKNVSSPVSHKNIILDGSEQLSPELISLLHQSYCLSETTDPSCLPSK